MGGYSVVKVLGISYFDGCLLRYSFAISVESITYPGYVS